LKSGSVMVVPKESQLFQPIGGVGARASAVAAADGLGLVVSPFTLDCHGVAEAKRVSTDRATSETRSSVRAFMGFFVRMVKDRCESFGVEIAQWGICDNLKDRARTEEGGRRWARTGEGSAVGVLVLVVLVFRLNPALSERAATGWRVNKPRPYEENGTEMEAV
jgi:hypothetical protein